uniref:Uncharacterized protein n=1 Tax=Arundo donax TaxID=35708 RepID=A0A0A9AAG7_ARUDO
MGPDKWGLFIERMKVASNVPSDQEKKVPIYRLTRTNNHNVVTTNKSSMFQRLIISIQKNQ